MMHNDNVVVAVTDNKGKAYREYDFEKGHFIKKSTVIIPFDSEYQILVKNNQNVRIKLDIDIDGTSVSGNGLIIDSRTCGNIERFVDVAKKFKFVPANSDKVADPTSSQNGLIRIQVQKEIKMPVFYSEPPTVVWARENTYTHDSSCLRGATFSSFQAQGSCVTQSSLSQSDLGATIEGGNSNQSFATTTWGGGGQRFIFEFQLKGKSENTDPEYLEYMRLKQKFG